MTRQPEKLNRYKRAGQVLRIVLYLALVVSAAVTLFGMPNIQARVESSQLGTIWLLAPSLAFGLFIVFYVADRLWLLRFRHYPASRALLQILLAGVFLLVLLPSSFREYRSILLNKPPAETLVALMQHRDERVRAIACELAAHRARNEVYIEALGQALNDPSAHVRKAAQISLRSLTSASTTDGELGQDQCQQLLRKLENPDSDKVPRDAASRPATANTSTAPGQQDANFADKASAGDKEH